MLRGPSGRHAYIAANSCLGQFPAGLIFPFRPILPSQRMPIGANPKMRVPEGMSANRIAGPISLTFGHLVCVLMLLCGVRYYSSAIPTMIMASPAMNTVATASVSLFASMPTVMPRVRPVVNR